MITPKRNLEAEKAKRDRILAGDPQEWATLESYLNYHTVSWINAIHIDRESIINGAIFEAARRWKPATKFYNYALLIAKGRLLDANKRKKRHIHLPITDTLNIPIEESPDSPCYGLFHNLHGSKITPEIPEDICL